MSKDITDGITFMPLPFSAGLDRWSCEDGRPGDATYADILEAEVVDDDAVFGSCLKMLKDAPVTRLRYMGETPLLPGCFLRISARLRAIDGPLPTVRIAGWPGHAGQGGALDRIVSGPLVTFEEIDDVVTVQAVVATAHRTGVDIVWHDAIYGHFGLDLTGPSGATLLIESLQIEDVSASFQSDLIAAIDVRDYGALADATTDATAAFRAADVAAQGREVIVPRGVFRLDDDIKLDSVFKFVGTVVQRSDRHFVLASGLDFSAYCRAFGDVETAFRKAFQAMSHIDPPVDLDLRGAQITLSAPLNMQVSAEDKACTKTYKTLRNGTFRAVPGMAWSSDLIETTATYEQDDGWHLRDIADCDRLVVGARVTGQGVGREVYLASVDVATRTAKLSQPLFGAHGTQKFSFEIHKYLLDFSSYEDVSQLHLDGITLDCAGVASGVLLATVGRGFSMRQCRINQPKDKGITSAGTGCVAMSISGSHFQGTNDPAERTSAIGLNANANDVRLHDNVFENFKHFAVVSGAGASITGNHFGHGHRVERSRPKGSLVLTKPMCAAVVTANSFVNASLLWTSEHTTDHEGTRQTTFGGLTVTGNSFTTNALAHWVSFIQVAPFGLGHVLDGFSVVGNVFRSSNGRINRVEALDTSQGGLDLSDMRAVTFSANTFHGVRDPVSNPANLVHDQRLVAKRWDAETKSQLPFDGLAKWIDSATVIGPLIDGAGQDVTATPWFEERSGADGRQARFHWDVPVAGRLRYQVRMDDPV